jgi:hypothetical protein
MILTKFSAYTYKFLLIYLKIQMRRNYLSFFKAKIIDSKNITISNGRICLTVDIKNAWITPLFESIFPIHSIHLVSYSPLVCGFMIVFSIQSILLLSRYVFTWVFFCELHAGYSSFYRNQQIVKM